MTCWMGFDLLLGFLVVLLTVLWIAERRER
jgi:hypothetical protein